MAGVWVAGALFFWWFEERGSGRLAPSVSAGPLSSSRGDRAVPQRGAPGARHDPRADRAPLSRLRDRRGRRWEHGRDGRSARGPGRGGAAPSGRAPPGESRQGRGSPRGGSGDPRGVRDLHRRGCPPGRGCARLDGVRPDGGGGRRGHGEPPNPHAVDRARAPPGRRVLDADRPHQAGADGDGPSLLRLRSGLRLPEARAGRGGLLAHRHAHRGRRHHLAPAARRLARPVRATGALPGSSPRRRFAGSGASVSAGRPGRRRCSANACPSSSDGGRAGCG